MYNGTQVQNFRNSGNTRHLIQQIMLKNVPFDPKIETVDYGNGQQRTTVKFDDGEIELAMDGNRVDHFRVDVDKDLQPHTFKTIIAIQGDDVRKVWFDLRSNSYILRSGRDYKFNSYRDVMIALVADEMSLHELSRES
tara:strand:- start:1759 stop:2172 length:414 start_codon:yes stop_codon:yes gene_type:complete